MNTRHGFYRMAKLAVATGILFSGEGLAQTSINLEFNTDGLLPSAQGFTYVTGGHSGTVGAPEASVFSVSGGYLHMNTAALGPDMGYAYYQTTGLFDPTKDLVIEFRMQLFGDSTRDFHIYALAPDLTFAGMAFEGGLMYIFRSPPPHAQFPVADTDFHVYRISYAASTRRYTVYVDGAQLGGAETFTYVGATPDLFIFGDATGHPGFNGRADIDYIRFQNPPVSGPLYSTCLLYDPTKAARSGSTVPIKLQLCDGTGNNLSSPSIVVHAVSITQTSTSISGPEDSGNANPDNDFRYDSTLGATGGYIFNLSTKGLATGTYNLNFTVTGDSAMYAAPFQVK